MNPGFTYSDLVMYAMSSTDAKKFKEMAQAFNSALNGGSGILEYRLDASIYTQIDQGKVKKKRNQIAENSGQTVIIKLRQKEQEDLEKLKTEFDQFIHKTNLLVCSAPS